MPSKKTPVPQPRFPWVSIAVGLIAVLATGLAFVDVSEVQSRVVHLVSTYGGGLINKTVPGVDCTQAEQFLTDAVAVKGFHVLCIKTDQSGKTLDIIAYKDGNAPLLTMQSSLEFGHLKTQLETLLDIEGPKDDVAAKYKQPYAFFTPDGQKLEELDQMVDQIVFVFEGGQFFWPGVRIGHKTVVKDVAGKGDVVLETLSLIPLVFSVEEFLKDEEIEVIMDLSLKHLKPSAVTLIDGHENRAATDWRTSTTYFLSSEKHSLLDEIDQRVADLTKVPVDHQEDVQVLRYEPTQKYDHHTDYFPAENHKNSPHVLESIEYGFKNRMITVFWYMSDVEKGGHTIFPRAGGIPRPVSMKDCSHGLKVPPKKRKVIVFYSMLPNGEGDPMSLHGGCPVEEGIKYSGNKWVWNKKR